MEGSLACQPPSTEGGWLAHETIYMEGCERFLHGWEPDLHGGECEARKRQLGVHC